MPTLSGTLQIHAPLNWLFFDSGKLTFCLCSCQRAIGSTKGPAKSVRPKTPHDTNIWLGGWYFHAFSVSLHFLFQLLALYFLCVRECFSSAASWMLAVPGDWRQHFPTSKVHIDNLNLQSVLSVKIIHTENISVEEGLSFRISRIASCNTMQFFTYYKMLELFGD